jgi:hypothetical protein
MRSTPVTNLEDRLIATLMDALELLNAFASPEEMSSSKPGLPSSQRRRASACKLQPSPFAEPIRLLHHFACTGGTLISKCMAAMPNVQLLSEVDPLSTALVQANDHRFAPTDIVTLMRQSTRGATSEFIIELFLNNLDIIHSHAQGLGQRLFLRDHAHSHFCMGDCIQGRPSLRAIVSSKFTTLSAVTVRHPLDSFLSLEANGWKSFTPFTFDEYCRRYVAFLRAYEGVPTFKYEDFTQSPHEVMTRICSVFQTPYSDNFSSLFSALKLSGDSGRAGVAIGHRPRRRISRRLGDEMRRSRHYRMLQALLQYDE